MNISNKNFFGDSLIAVRHPKTVYGCVFAPSAIYVNVQSAGVVFCGENTEVVGNCQDIRRGNWRRVFNRIIDADTVRLVFVIGAGDSQLYANLKNSITVSMIEGLRQKTA